MSKNKQQTYSVRKRVVAAGVRRREVDVDQLALVYYLLARRRVETERQHGVPRKRDDEEAA